MYILFIHNAAGELAETHHYGDLVLATHAYMLCSHDNAGVPAVVAMGRRDNLLLATPAYRERVMGLPRLDVAS